MENDYSLHTPAEVANGLAARAKALRLKRGWKQATLAERSGVALGSLKRFEQTGRTSLKHLLAIASALGRLDEFTELLRPPPADTMAALERSQNQTRRQRGIR